MPSPNSPARPDRPLFRTMLFAPGNHARKVEKCFSVGADCVILDLEDAVAIAEKEATREKVVAALQPPRTCRGYVRVNAYDTPFCLGDLEAVVAPGVDGIVLPKLESAAQLQAVEWVVANLERRRGLTEGGIDILPIIETARGIASLAEIVACRSRVRRLAFGAGDYTLDVNITWTLEERELDHARANIVVASRAGGLEPPVDSVFIHLGQIDALGRSAELVKGMGFQGKLCIHPEQVPVVNRAFSPTDDEVALARRYIQAFAEAEAAGSASIQVDGFFIDYPIVERARRVVAMAEATGQRAGE